MVNEISENEMAEPTNIVIFGAAGDLCKRKLMPSLVRMFDCGLIHPKSRIIGLVNRRSKQEWLNLIKEGFDKYSPQLKMNETYWQEFSQRLTMITGDLADDAMYEGLASTLQTYEGKQNAMFYCAIPPDWYETTAQGLEKAGLTDETNGYRRLVIEKPFGHDLESAKKLNQILQSYFLEEQIYRIDHYLGKISVQNLLVYRFSNSIMEPLWNRNYIDNIQIFAAESIGIEYRAPYYEKSGALRDMIQSHLMQMLTLVAMEPPVEFSAEAVRIEKVKVLDAIQPIDIECVNDLAVSGQYASGEVEGKKVPAYVSENNVNPESSTETFAAVKFYIDNWRWQGVPFILWTGKRMEKKVSEVIINFRKPPFNLFDSHASLPAGNKLTFRLQPEGSVSLGLNVKKTGLTTDNKEMVMQAAYADDHEMVADAYEILMHDVLIADRTLFSSSSEVEKSWAIVAPILKTWEDRVFIERYKAGSFTIPSMDKLTEDCVGGWYKPSNYG